MECKTTYNGEEFDLESEKYQAEQLERFNKELSEAIVEVKDFSDKIQGVLEAITNERYAPAINNMINHYEETGNDELSTAIKELLALQKENFNFEREKTKLIHAKFFVKNAKVIASYLKNQLNTVNKDDSLPLEVKGTFVQAVHHYSAGLQQAIDYVKEDFDLILDLNHPFIKDLNNTSGITKSIDVAYKNIAKNISVDFIWNSIPKENLTLKPEVQKLIDDFTKRRDEALKAGKKGIAKYHQRKLDELSKKVITKKDILDALSNKTDSNALSMYFEAAIMSGDPIIASLQKKLFISRQKIRANILSKKLPMLNKLANKFTDINGKVPDDLKNYYSKYYEIVENYYIFHKPKEELIDNYNIIESYNDEIHLVSARSFSINRSQSPAFDKEIAKLDFAIKVAESKNKGIKNSTEVANARSLKNEFVKKYSYRPYKDTYYDAFESLDPVLKTKVDELEKEIIEKKEQLQSNPSSETFKNWLEARNAKSKLRFDKNEDGTFTEEAIKLQEYYDGIGDLFTDEDYTQEEMDLAWKKYNTAKASFLADIKIKISSGQLPVRLEERITKTLLKTFEISRLKKVISQEFYDARSFIWDELDDAQQKLNEKLGREKDNSIKELYQSIVLKTLAFKDEGRKILGQVFSKEEAEKIKQTEIEIEKIKNNTAKYLMSKADEDRFDNLASKEDLTKEEQEELDELASKSEREKELLEDEEIQRLIVKIKNNYKQLFAMQKTVPTEYYHAILEREKDKIRNKILEEENNKKNKDDLLTSDQIEDKVESLVVNTDWFKRNHYKKRKTVLTESGEYQSMMVDEPLYIWKLTEPKQKRFIKTIPFFHLNKKVKEEYINEDRVLHRFNPNKYVARKGTRFDKQSVNYLPEPGEKPYPKDKASIEFLSELKDFYQQEQESLEESRRFGYALPLFEKTMMDRLTESGGVKETAKNAWEGLVRRFKPNENDVTEGIGIDLKAINEEGVHKEGNKGLMDNVPLKMRKNFKEEDLNFSYDMIGLIYRFMERNMLRGELQSLLPTYKMVLDTLDKDNDFVQEGENKKFSFKNITTLKSGQSVRFQHMQENIKSIFFGETVKESNANILGVNISLPKLVGNINSLVALTTLGHNIPGAIVNGFSAGVQKIIESAGGVNMNFSQYGNGHRLFFKYAGDLLSDGWNFSENRSMISNMLLAWDSVQGQYGEMVGREFRKTPLKTLAESRLFSMVPREWGELEVQASVWLGKMDSITVVLRDNESKSETNMTLLEAYIKLYQETDENGEQKNTLTLDDYNGKYQLFKTELKGSELIKGKEFTINDESDLKTGLSETNIRLNGNYDSFNKTVAEKYFAGKASFLFRRFFVPMVVNRYGGANEARYNIGQKDWIQGFYIVFGKMVANYVRTGGASEVLKDSWDDPRGREAIFKMGIETTIIALLGVATMLLGYDEREKDLGWGNLHLLWLLRKLQAETRTFGPLGGYSELKRIINNPISGMFQVDNAVKTATLLASYITGSEDAFYTRDVGPFDKGTAKFWSPLIKLTGAKPIMYTIYPEYMLKAYKKGEALRNR